MIDKVPYVSVIVPVLNGEQTIKECLVSLLGMDYPRERREIIVVDNGSTDRTASIVNHYPVKYVTEGQRGFSYARNAGIENSGGRILAFTDVDCIVATGWLWELIRGFDRDDVGVVVGELVAFPPETPTERYMSLSKPQWNKQNLSYADKPWFNTACFAIRRDVFEEIGLFDPRFTTGVGCGDIDFAWRFFGGSSFKFNFRPKALVFHRHRTSARTLFKRYFRIAQGQALLKRKHPKKINWGWKQEIGAHKDLVLTLLALVRAAISSRSRNGEMTEFSYQYFELVRKLSERIGFIYGMFKRFRA